MYEKPAVLDFNKYILPANIISINCIPIFNCHVRRLSLSFYTLSVLRYRPKNRLNSPKETLNSKDAYYQFNSNTSNLICTNYLLEAKLIGAFFESRTLDTRIHIVQNTSRRNDCFFFLKKQTNKQTLRSTQK